MKYTAPVESSLFLLKTVLGFDNENTEAILTEAAKLCEETIAPTNQQGDKVGCNWINSGPGNPFTTVLTPAVFKEPYKKFCEGGWLGLSVPEQYGGQGLPFVVATAMNEYVSSSNMAWSLFPGITRGAIQALLVSGSELQKDNWIPKMASGEWCGTMCLTEPHCGTDLGLLKTKAVPVNEQQYKITGQKIFISGGDHDLTENIMHLVLARIEGDVAGVKGISMFAVPKIIGGARNNLSAGSIEEKMGIHGSPTCVMNFDESLGYLVGERGKGLNAMFIMMNEMRLGCAVHGLSQSELAYQNALSYAKERVQSAAITNPKGGSVAIINHPDIRRMLMDVRCINEAARLLVLEAAMLVDVVNAQYSRDELLLRYGMLYNTDMDDVAVEADIKREKEKAEDRLGLLTPVLKGVLTDYGVDNAIKMQQVWGGHGYVRDNGMEQIVRDARIAMIYEGTNNIQAMDLVGRKLPKDMGRAIKQFFEDSEETIRLAYEFDLHTLVQPITAARNDLRMATEWLVGNALSNPNNAGSAAYDYMKMFGLVLLGLAHVNIMLRTQDQNRRDNAMYFVERMLPETRFLLERIRTGSGIMMGANFD